MSPQFKVSLQDQKISPLGKIYTEIKFVLTTKPICNWFQSVEAYMFNGAEHNTPSKEIYTCGRKCSCDTINEM